MSRIFVDFTKLENMEKDIFNVWLKLREDKDNFKGCMDKLDWEVKSQERIDRRSKKEIEKIDELIETLDSHSKFLLSTYDKYEALDNFENISKLNLGENKQTEENEKTKKAVEQQKVIDDFEKKNPDIKRDFDNFLNSGGEKNNLTDEEKREIKYRVYTADDPERAIFLSHLDKAKIKNTDTRSESIFSLSKDATAYGWVTHGIYLRREDNHYRNYGDERYDYIAIYHEYGHSVDDLSDFKNWLGNDTLKYKAKSESTGKEMTITEAIMYDVYYNEDNRHSLINFYNKYKGTDLIDDNMTFEKFKKGVESGKILSSAKEKLVYTSFIYGSIDAQKEIPANMVSVSDIYGGATQNKGKAARGHDDDYWDNKAHLPTEAWAEYYAGHFIDDKSYLDNMREYLPTACEIMDSYADDLAKKARPINT